MRRLSACLAAVWLPLSQPLLVSSVVAGATVLAVQATAHAQSAEAVGKIAEAITVRIEGATQGSGVLVRREGNRYTVLTAWHVVADQKPGEELAITTSDGKIHNSSHSEIRRVGGYDIAMLTFDSPVNYLVATIGSLKDIALFQSIYVCGFSVHSAPQDRVSSCAMQKGSLLGFSANPDGSSGITYNALTYAGFSGGAVLDSKGNLIAVHTKGFLDLGLSQARRNETKTGINTGISVHSADILQSSVLLGSPNLADNSELLAALIAASRSPATRDDAQSDDCSNPGSLTPSCQDRSRRSPLKARADVGSFDVLDITRAKERRCLPAAAFLLDSVFNLLAPWNWFRKVDNKCVSYTFKARFYSEVAAPFCGVIVSRYGPNYKIPSRDDYAWSGRDHEILWDKLKADRDEGAEYLAKSIISARLYLDSGVSVHFMPPQSLESNSPALLSNGAATFQFSEAARSQYLTGIQRLKDQSAVSDTLVLESFNPLATTKNSLVIRFTDGNDYTIPFGKKESQKLGEMLARCSG